MMNVICSANFKSEVIDYDGIVVVDYFTQWCSKCKQLMPYIEKLSNEISDVKFVKVDCTNISDVVKELFTDNGLEHGAIRGLPHVDVIKNGRIEEIKGTVTPSIILKTIEAMRG